MKAACRILQVGLAAILGCSKPPGEKLEVKAPPPRPPAHQAAERVVAPLPKLSGIERDYLAAQEFETRVAIIYRIAKGVPGDAVQSLGRLFLLEKDPELKALMLSALGDVEGEFEAKLTILRQGLTIEQAPDVRHAAAAELEWLGDRRALPLWQKLANDPDPEIRDLAGDIIHASHAAQGEK